MIPNPRSWSALLMTTLWDAHVTQIAWIWTSFLKSVRHRISTVLWVKVWNLKLRNTSSCRVFGSNKILPSSAHNSAKHWFWRSWGLRHRKWKSASVKLADSVVGNHNTTHFCSYLQQLQCDKYVRETDMPSHKTRCSLTALHHAIHCTVT